MSQQQCFPNDQGKIVRISKMVLKYQCTGMYMITLSISNKLFEIMNPSLMYPNGSFPIYIYIYILFLMIGYTFDYWIHLSHWPILVLEHNFIYLDLGDLEGTMYIHV